MGMTRVKLLYMFRKPLSFGGVWNKQKYLKLAERVGSKLLEQKQNKNNN